ncbi:MAG: mechanosensitive ion channel protein MscS [Sulfurimonas sp. RIFOXYD12_FULL_33_39]|nr:MAG: mechanosensitive ion channel protein MscS [Sulfurimonas sp. RIFOXYD12_FULL_33_39]OHE13030.1 MAG: mechanosensitive ion channel protein MscS [Sulfurimonas sp. RIFOXYD2_FULL_34_21]DAB27446.1 MAG TPA: mechanosensitive ion channel protein MscS [Sulfurimonas sp. UBA10385]
MLIFILLIVTISFSADVDTKLYEDGQKESYYQEIQNQISADEKGKKKTVEILKEERLYLQRVRSAASQDIQIDKYDLESLSNKSLTLDNYYSAVNFAALLHVKQNENRKILNTINSKSLFLKQAITNIIEEEKPKLFSYQLQYAYYKLQEKNIEAKIKLLQAHEQEIKKMLFSTLGLIECDKIGSIDEKLKLNDKDINVLSSQKVALQINLEKALIEDSTKVEQTQKKLDSAETQYQELINKKVVYKIEQSLCMLKEKKNKPFFQKISEIEFNIDEITLEHRFVHKEELNILREIAKGVFGTTKLFFGSTLHEIKGIFTQIQSYFVSAIFVFNEQPISLISLIKAIVLVIFGFFAGIFYKRWIARISRKWPDMSQMSIRLASNIGYYMIVTISFVIAIGSLGIDMTSISMIAGALSIGIGFGLQTVVSNFIAGVILMFERTIRIGDMIEISDKLRGRVTDMRIRSTTIKTFDNIDIVIPNSSFIQNNVINWTLEDPSRRLHIPFGVAYGTDVDYVKQIIINELKESKLTYINDDSTKEPEIWMIGMNNSRLDFELLVWVEWDSKLRPNSLKSDFLILIYNSLNKYGIEIPFPQLDLHVKHKSNKVLEIGAKE